MKKPFLLMILDGWGINPYYHGNAIRLARTPNFDYLCQKYPFTSLSCFGEAVGLHSGLMGNSEVGHENLGAGRTVTQEILFIDRAIDNESFFEREALMKAMRLTKERGSSLHIMGLTSEGGVHSSEKHYFALLSMAKRYKITPSKVFFHAILDGRDTDPHGGLEYIRRLEREMDSSGVGRIATIVGRFYAMDRDNRWERVQVAYDAFVLGIGEKFAVAEEAVKAGYARKDRNDTDEFMEPKIIVGTNGNPIGRILDGDVLIFFNFRGDRPREILRALTDDTFQGFDRKKRAEVHAVCMTQYERDLLLPYAFKRERPAKIFPEIISERGLRQLRIAETEKYAHVTFFFNNQLEEKFPGEERILIYSPKVETYDLQPEMSANRVTGALLDEMAKEKYDFILLNFANPDMVGHTGMLEAAIKAIETVDHCLGLVIRKLQDQGGTAIVTADHGNAEEEISYNALKKTRNGEIDYAIETPHTQHTLENKVPFILINENLRKCSLREDGVLGDVAPTILYLMDIPKPDEMTGCSLIRLNQ